MIQRSKKREQTTLNPSYKFVWTAQRATLMPTQITCKKTQGCQMVYLTSGKRTRVNELKSEKSTTKHKNTSNSLKFEQDIELKTINF